MVCKFILVFQIIFTIHVQATFKLRKKYLFL